MSLTYDPALQVVLAGGEPFQQRWLLWIACRDRDTGAPAPLGFKTGEDSQEYEIGGQERLYHGTRGTFVPPIIRDEIGLEARAYTATLGAGLDTTEALLRGRDTRAAEAEMHVAFYDGSGGFLATHRFFKGFMNGRGWSLSGKGGTASIRVKLLSVADELGDTNDLRKSDASQRLRGADRARRYGAVTDVEAE